MSHPEYAIYERLADAIGYVYGMGVKGDIAEFGTMSGKTALAISVAVHGNNVLYSADPRGPKRAWFFDSFVGLPEARFEVDRSAPHVAEGIWPPGSCKGLSEVDFGRLISSVLDADAYSVVPGWFKDTVPLIPRGQQFALLHIDGDLYESAIDVLDPLFKSSSVARGAVILFDDWNCNAADPCRGERLAWAEVSERWSLRFSDMGRHSVAGHSFIVHDYEPLGR
jgi:hypothetical protein